MRDDDGFNVLNYLNKQGKVTIGGVDFGKVRELLKEVRKDKISATFFGVQPLGFLGTVGFQN